MKNSNSLSHSSISNNTFVYDYDKCMNCIAKHNELGIVSNCPHCGSENYDTGCIPSVVQRGKPTNCVSKDLSLEQAYRVCKAKSNSTGGGNIKCQIVKPDAALSYQKDECGDDYYCSYDFSNNCSYNVCNLNDDYIFGNCSCEKVPPHKDPYGHLKPGQGIECIKGNNCLEYTPHSIPSVQHNDPQLIKFYSGYNSYMDVPNINSMSSVAFINRQIA